MAEQRLDSPQRGESESPEEGEPDHASLQIGFAPALEHGDESNKEQDDTADGEELQKHVLVLPSGRTQG